MSQNESKLKNIVEAALLAAAKPLNIDVLLNLFLDEDQPDRKQLRAVLEELQQDYEGRGIDVVEVKSGWRIQVRKEYAPWVSRLWEEKPARYSRALLETLALIAYRQPITRGEIEEIRGVTVSTNIMKTLLERDWVHVVGQRDVPGKPSLYATTREFLDYFSLKGLDDLPTLAEIKDLDELNQKLDLPDPDKPEKQPEPVDTSGNEPVESTGEESGSGEEPEKIDVAGGDESESAVDTDLHADVEDIAEAANEESDAGMESESGESEETLADESPDEPAPREESHGG